MLPLGPFQKLWPVCVCAAAAAAARHLGKVFSCADVNEASHLLAPNQLAGNSLYLVVVMAPSHIAECERRTGGTDMRAPV